MMEINRDEAAYRTSHLVHQTRSFPKIHILCELARFCLFFRRDFPIVVKLIQDLGNQNLKRCGTAHAGTRQHIRFRIARESADAIAQLMISCRDAADQRFSRIDFFGLSGQIFEIDRLHFKSIGMIGDDRLFFRDHDRCRIEINGCGQDPAELMIGMIAADFGSARGTEQICFAVAIKFHRS